MITDFLLNYYAYNKYKIKMYDQKNKTSLGGFHKTGPVVG